MWESFHALRKLPEFNLCHTQKLVTPKLNHKIVKSSNTNFRQSSKFLSTSGRDFQFTFLICLSIFVSVFVRFELPELWTKKTEKKSIFLLNHWKTRIFYFKLMANNVLLYKKHNKNNALAISVVKKRGQHATCVTKIQLHACATQRHVDSMYVLCQRWEF